MISAGSEDEQAGIGVDLEVSPCYPTSFDLPNVTPVASLGCGRTLYDRSNHDSGSVDLVAPGTYILNATADQGCSYMTGTPMAIPMVSAAAVPVYSYGENISGP